MDKFEIVLLTEKQRDQIIKCVRPTRSDSFSYQNLNLLYGVQHKEKKYVLTITYYLSDTIKRCDEPDDYTFILLFPKREVLVSCIRKRGEEISVTGKLPEEVSEEEFLEAVRFLYGEEETAFSRKYEKEHDGKSIYRAKREIIDQYLPEQEHKDEKESQEHKKIKFRKESKRKKRNFYISCVFLVIALIFLISYFVLKPRNVSYLWDALLALVVACIGFVSIKL